MAPALTGGLLGCGAEPTPVGGGVTWEVRDSAGIEIITTSIGREGGEDWRTHLDGALVSIGQLDGDPAYTLESGSAATILDDDRLLIQDGHPPRMLLYDSAGQHIRSISRLGEGPGEYQSLAGYHVVGDTIIAFDPEQRRLIYLPLEGGRSRSVSVEGFPQMGFPLGAHYLPASREIVAPLIQHPLELADGIIPSWTWRINATSGIAVRGQALNLMEGFVVRGRVEQKDFASPGSPIQTEHGYGWRDGVSNEFQFFGPDHRLERIVRFDRPRRPVTDSMIARYEQQVRDTPGLNPQLLEQLAEKVYADSMTSLGTPRAFPGGWLMADPLRQYSDSPADLIFERFDSDWRWVGTWTRPLSLRTLDFADSLVVLRGQDELGVPRVEVHRWPPAASGSGT